MTPLTKRTHGIVSDGIRGTRNWAEEKQRTKNEIVQSRNQNIRIYLLATIWNKLSSMLSRFSAFLSSRPESKSAAVYMYCAR